MSDKASPKTGSASTAPAKNPFAMPSDTPSVASSITPLEKAPPAFGHSNFSFGAGFESFAKPANSSAPPAPGANPAPIFAAPSEPSVPLAEFKDFKAKVLEQEQTNKREKDQLSCRIQETTSRVLELELATRNKDQAIADKDRRIEVQNGVIKALKDRITEQENSQKESEGLLAELTEAPADDKLKTEKQWRSEVYKLRHLLKEQKKAAEDITSRVAGLEAAEKNTAILLEAANETLKERKAAGDTGAKNIRKTLQAEFDAKLKNIELEQAREIALHKGHLQAQQTDSQLLLSTYKTTISELRAANETLEGDLSTGAASLQTAKDRENQSQEELSAALDENDVLQEKVRRLEGEVAASKQASKAAGDHNGQLQTDLKRADDALAAAKAKEGEHVAAVAAAEKRGKDLAAVQFREELHAKAADFDRVEAELEALSSAQSKASAEHTALMAEHQRVLARYDQMAAIHTECVDMADVDQIKRELDELNSVLVRDEEEKLWLQSRIVELEGEVRQGAKGPRDLGEELGEGAEDEEEEENEEEEPLEGSDREGETAPEEEVEEGPGAQAAVVSGEGASPAGGVGSLAARLSGGRLVLVAMGLAFAFFLAALVLSGSGSSMLGTGHGQFGWDGERPGVGGVALRALGGVLSKAQADGVARSLWRLGWAGGQAWGGGL